MLIAALLLSFMMMLMFSNQWDYVEGKTRKALMTLLLKGVKVLACSVCISTTYLGLVPYVGSPLHLPSQVSWKHASNMNSDVTFVPRISIVQRTFCPLGTRTHWKVTSWKWEGAGDHMHAVPCSWTIRATDTGMLLASQPLFFFSWFKGLNVEILCECVALGSQTWELIMLPCIILPIIPVAMKIHCGKDGSRWSLLLFVWYFVFLQAKAQNKCSKFHLDLVA